MKNLLKDIFNRNNHTIKCEKESDYYGLSFICNKLHDQGLPKPLLGKSFKHGWSPNRLTKYPKQIIHWGELDDLHICFNDFQREFLEENGYSNVLALGAPFLYAHKLLEGKLEPRQKDSYLIMPAHTLSHIGGDMFFEDFFSRAILDAGQKNASNVSACLHRESISTQSVTYLSGKGVSIISGAKSDYSLSLVEQVKMFSRFEYMITNSFGSHVLYALFSGCKIKVENNYYFTLEDLMKHVWYKDNIELAKAYLENANKIQQVYPEFCSGWVDPNDHRELIDREIGFSEFENSMKRKTIAKLFNNNSLQILKWNLKNGQCYSNFETYLKNTFRF